LLGLPPTGRIVELPADLLVNSDLTLSASFGYTSEAWQRTVELLNEGRIQPGRIVTHRFRLEDFGRAFEALGAGDGVRGKILLEIAGESSWWQRSTSIEGVPPIAAIPFPCNSRLHQAITQARLT